jgi:hypothetical protein
MAAVLAAVIGLILFFCLTLCFCVRDPKQEADRRSDSDLDLMRKSPFGRWRY